MMPVFFTVHSDLVHEGPGDRESLDWVPVQVWGPQAGRAQAERIRDAGCGPGADITGLLPHAPAGEGMTMETCPPDAAQARATFADDPRVTVLDGDMSCPPGRFDMIWSAGAVYLPGVTAVLDAERAEVDLWHAHGDDCGYLQIMARPA